MTDNEWVELSHEMERQDGFHKREKDAIANSRGKKTINQQASYLPSLPQPLSHALNTPSYSLCSISHIHTYFLTLLLTPPLTSPPLNNPLPRQEHASVGTPS